MDHATWILFVFVSLAAVLTPGPAMLAILGHALAKGARPTVPVVIGNASGAIVLMGASIAGLAAVLAALPHGFEVLKWAGVLYLLWLGLGAWKKAAPAAIPAPIAKADFLRADSGAFVRGLLIAASNPKALLFYGAVLPQFVDPTRPALMQFAIMAATFALLELSATGIVTMAADKLAPVLRRYQVRRGLDRLGGGVMIAAALLLALSPSKALP